MKELVKIQSELKAPKNQINKFGGYKYRSCSDILEAVKPLLKEENCTLVISDDIVMVGSRIYIKATATLSNSNGEKESVTSYAREEEMKKGNDAAQITGAASSYARKYALNGLFAIDDTADPDAQDNTKMGTKSLDVTSVIAQVNATENEDVLNALVRASKPLYENVEFQEAVKAKRLALRKENIYNHEKINRHF